MMSTVISPISCASAGDASVSRTVSAVLARSQPNPVVSPTGTDRTETRFRVFIEASGRKSVGALRTGLSYGRASRVSMFAPARHPVRGAREGPGRAGRHAGEAGEAGAADEVEEHRLRLVGRRVAGGDAAKARLASGAGEEGVAGAARRLLQREALRLRQGANVGATGEERQAEGLREAGDEARLRFGGGGAAQAVGEGGDGEPPGAVARP